MPTYDETECELMSRANVECYIQWVCVPVNNPIFYPQIKNKPYIHRAYAFILELSTVAVSPGIEPGGIVFPSQNNNIVLYLFGVLQTMWELEIFSSAPSRLWWPIAICRVDRLFPVTWLGNVWEPAPPPHCSMGMDRLFNPTSRA